MASGSTPRQTLETPVQYLKGVGPVRAHQLTRLGIERLEDLLHHYPHDYLERGGVQALARARAGQRLTCVARVLDVQQRRGRRGRAMVSAVVAEGDARMLLIWFNAAFVARHLHVGESLVLSGEVSAFQGRLQMVNPQFEPAGSGGDLEEGRPLPRYPLTAGIQQAGMRRFVRRALDAVLDQVEDPVPTPWREALGLPPLREALDAVHRPRELEAATRGRQRLAFDEALALQLSVGARRRSLLRRRSACQVGELGELTARYVESLGFSLTPAQRRVLRAIRQDVGKPFAMHRLLQGDVGSGKTLVAIIAMLWLVESGAQAAFMAPTEVLARQQAERQLALLEPLGIAGALLTGSTPTAERRQILTGLREGDLPVVFGTHALIQESVEFKRLGIAVVDEQHRFGVVQRAALSGGGAHMLVMSATPIPRSLALTVYADLDLSIIDELPPGRTPIETRVLEERRLPELYARVRHRVAAGERAYLVFPLVEESEGGDVSSAVAAHEELAADALAGLRLGLLHGRLPSAEKARVSRAFADGSLDVLVATTVVEVGLDVPEATLMIVHHAERFGLAQLHQLRGRVGRGERASWCVLVPSEGVGRQGRRRLEQLVATTDGFVLAEADLKERGMGDLQGIRQHGALPFKLLNPLMDSALVEAARRRADELLESDPSLGHPAHRPLAAWIERLGRRNPFWAASG